MDRESSLKCIQVAFKAAKLEAAVGGDLSKLSEPVRTFLIVNGAQGVIDNSGYRFFLERIGPTIHPTKPLPPRTRPLVVGSRQRICAG